MGTSSSHYGPGDRSLLPSWAVGDEDAVSPDGDAGDLNPNDSADGNDGQADATQPAETGPVEQEPPRYWQYAKSGMTRYARSNGDAERLRSAGSGYVQAKGGARRAASSATSGRSASRQVAGFLSSVVRSGIQQALDSIGLSDIVGQSSDRVLARLVEALAPAGSTKEEAAARRATIEVLEFLYENVIGEEGDLGGLEQMNQEMVEEAIMRSVSGYIFNRWLDELGLSIEKGAVSESAAIRLEREVKEYIKACVALELNNRSVIEIDWGGREGHQILDRVYRDAYALLAAGS